MFRISKKEDLKNAKKYGSIYVTFKFKGKFDIAIKAITKKIAIKAITIAFKGKCDIILDSKASNMYEVRRQFITVKETVKYRKTGLV